MDSEILAEVYAELMGGRQATLILASQAEIRQQTQIAVRRDRPQALAPLLSAEETEAHQRFLGGLGDKAIWRDYIA
jgi:DNA polymerase-3 subunit epsilon